MTRDMKTRKRKRIELRMYMQELLVAMGLGMFVLGMLFETAFRAWKFCTGYTRSATRCAEVKVIRRNWRWFARQLPAPASLPAPGELEAGTCHARVEKERLVFEIPDRRRVTPLPGDTRAVIGIEPDGRDGQLLVLTVITNNRVGDRCRARSSRIVARVPRRPAPARSGGLP